MTEAWISAETEPKENDFRGIMSMHMSICRAIIDRWSGGPYLYIDLFAGPGHLEFNRRRFLGSPLIVNEISRMLGIEYEGVNFEKDPSIAGQLESALRVFPGGEAMDVYPLTCQKGLPQWLTPQAVQLNRYGLVYSDPIRDEIPHGLLNQAAAKFPKVDLLSYVSATQYKRRRGVDPSRPLISDHIAAVNKKVVLIREPIGAWQWTFVLWSNWVNFPEWRKRGFYRLDSDKGQRVLDQLDLTKKEWDGASNTALF